MNGTLNLGKNRIANVGSTISDLDAVTKKFSDNNYIRKDSDDVREDLSAKSKKYVNVRYLVNEKDLSTKQYLDTKVGTEGGQVRDGTLEVDRLTVNNTTDCSYTRERAYTSFLRTNRLFNHESLIVEGQIGKKVLLTYLTTLLMQSQQNYLKLT